MDHAAEPPVEQLPDTIATVRERTTFVSQLAGVLAVVVPPLGVLSAMGVLWGVAFRWVDLIVLLVFYVITGLGITAGWHRLFSHKSYSTSRAMTAFWAIAGALAIQGPLTQWVTDHRKHHALSDKEGDPHSPHAGFPDTAWGAVRGFVHAHVGWMFRNLGMEQGREYGRDLYDDRLIRLIDRVYLLWVALTLGIPFGIGYAVGGAGAGAEALVWGGLIRIFAYQHATFSVNSICHMFGRQDYQARDESRNNWVVAMLVFGEGWHNNHHAFPASARHGLHRWQVDCSWLLIRAAERVGLVWNVKVPTGDQLERRRVARAA